jgi:hypothetical protein
MPSSYRFSPSDSSIFAEILLPKRSHFQGVLYETLTAAFSSDEIRNHFSTAEKVAKIKSLLAEYTTLKPKLISELDNLNPPEPFSPVLKGYSMYEVDGVFQDDELGMPIEERTQVIRIILIPEIEVWYNKIKTKYSGSGEDFPLSFKEIRGITRYHLSYAMPVTKSEEMNCEYIDRIRLIPVRPGPPLVVERSVG